MLLDVIDEEVEISKLKKIDQMAARVFHRVPSSSAGYWDAARLRRLTDRIIPAIAGIRRYLGEGGIRRGILC